MGFDKASRFQRNERMVGSWVDVAAMQEPDTILIVMVTGAVLSLHNQVDALLEELKLRDLVASKFQKDMRSFTRMIAEALPALNRGNRRFDCSFFRVLQLMCKVLEEARDALDDYFLASISILHARTLKRRLQAARDNTKHAISLYKNSCDTKRLRSSRSSRFVHSSSMPQRVTADRELGELLKKLQGALLQLEMTWSSDSKPCPKSILKLVAKMRSDSSTIHHMESFTGEELDHFCAVGGVEALVQLLNSPVQPVREQAMVNLKSLLTNDKTRLEICVAPGVLEKLAAMVSSTYGEVQHGALEVLRCLLRSKGHIDYMRILFPGIVESLLELLDSSFPQVQADAAGALRELSLDAGNHVKIAAAPQAVETLVRFFSSKSPTVQFCAAAALCSICVDESVRTQAINLRDLPTRLLLLLEVYEPWDLPVLDCSRLQPARSRKPEQELSPGAAGWWVVMMDSEIESYQVRALDMLSTFTDTLMQMAVQDGVLSRLVKVLHSPSVVIQEHAANTLLNFSIVKEYELKIARENGVIRRLVELLDSGSFGVRQIACKVLESLSFEKKNGIRVAKEAGAIEKLSKLLFEESLIVQANAASALWNLANTNDVNKAEMARVGDTLERLVELLKSKSSLVTEKAAGVLMNLSFNTDNRSKISAISSAIPRLVRLLQSWSTLVHQNAAGALYNLSADEETARKIAATPRAVRSLVKLLGSMSGIVQEYAAGAIANISYSEQTREKCRQTGALPMLRELKTSSSTAARTQAKRALDLYSSS